METTTPHRRGRRPLYGGEPSASHQFTLRQNTLDRLAAHGGSASKLVDELLTHYFEFDDVAPDTPQPLIDVLGGEQ